MEEKTKGKLLEEMLCYKTEHIAKADESIVAKSMEFCEGYKDFLTASKTERLAAANILDIAKANGYVEFNPDGIYSAGDKVYYNNRGRME